jgi:large subunit ribosomal protein L10
LSFRKGEEVARPDKAATVTEIAERFKNSDAALLTEYRGLSVSEIQELRRNLREANTDYKVLKNTLTRLAVRDLGLEDLVDQLEGPTAIAFVHGDPAAAAKAIDEASKKYPVLVVKGGLLGDLIIDADRAKALAKLEPREVILSKIAMMVNQPAQLTINALTALLRDTGSMLAQVLAQKEEEAPAAEAAPEPAPEAAPEPVAQTTDADETPVGEPSDQEASPPTEEPGGPQEDAAAEGAEEASAGTSDTGDESPVAEEAAEEAAAGEAPETAETTSESEAADGGEGKEDE